MNDSLIIDKPPIVDLLDETFSKADQRFYYLLTRPIKGSQKEDEMEIMVVTSDMDGRPGEKALSHPVRCLTEVAAAVVELGFEFSPYCFPQFLREDNRLAGPQSESSAVPSREVFTILMQLIKSAL